jgi:hypothetical protein
LLLANPITVCRAAEKIAPRSDTAVDTRKLEAEGVIQRKGDGFPLDQIRVA